MKKLLTILLLFISIVAYSTTYYVSTVGSDGNPGTIGSPFASFQKGINVAVAGDTVYFRGGTYYCNTLISINPTISKGVTGTLENPICYFGYPGESVVFDFSNYNSTSHTNFSALGINYVQYIEFKGFTICNLKQTYSDNMPQGIAEVYSTNLTFENITVHDIGGRGFFMFSGAWKDFYDNGYTETVPSWDSPIDTTRFINCDVYNICDSLSANPGNAGDGWTTGNYKGNYWLFQGCRVWNYSDDGFDLNPIGGKYRLISCWAMPTDKYAEYDIEGGGFKLNGNSYDYDPSVRGDTLVYVSNCIAAYCPGVGFYLNINATGENYGFLVNNTSYRNDAGFMDSNPDGGDRHSIYRNNIAIYSTSIYEAGIYNPSIYTESHNNWDATNSPTGWPGWVYANDITITDADFVSVDSSQIHAARKADGSLPDITLLTLAPGSDAIDYGIDVGLPYNGTAPDIGYAEYSDAVQTGTDITSFTFADIVGVAAVNATTHTVTAVLKAGEDISAVIPTFTLSLNATSDPVSGVEDDYTNPVIITVTAEDLSEQAWTVTITEDDEPVPTVATVATTSASYTSVTANITGRIYSANGGTLTARGVCWSTSASPTIADRHTTYSPYVGTFTDVIRGLRGGTTYHARAYATTSESGTSYGDDVSFTTPKSNIGMVNGKIGIVNGKIGMVK